MVHFVPRMHLPSCNCSSHVATGSCVAAAGSRLVATGLGLAIGSRLIAIGPSVAIGAVVRSSN